ncbi:hypothetical protein ACN38_g12413 [Penicillium nordicum]|uniref:Uncharacterized protein n=1 Tax=Penicillium nordicum TaxID=229535 RepID=A0A0M8NT87_9EURO|nr:hypothetical protein ACN38_g12413 [Penicillium nordicum]
MTKPAISTIWAVIMTKRNIWYIQYSKSHDLHGIIPCKSMYATLHFDSISCTITSKINCIKTKITLI